MKVAISPIATLFVLESSSLIDFLAWIPGSCFSEWEMKKEEKNFEISNLESRKT